MSKESERINCRNCRHFYVTWDQAMPYGCKLYGIKSRQNPNIIVKESSGTQCLGFEVKQIQEKKDRSPYGE